MIAAAARAAASRRGEPSVGSLGRSRGEGWSAVGQTRRTEEQEPEWDEEPEGGDGHQDAAAQAKDQHDPAGGGRRGALASLKVAEEIADEEQEQAEAHGPEGGFALVVAVDGVDDAVTRDGGPAAGVKDGKEEQVDDAEQHQERTDGAFQ